jgi:hypothetical protein
MIGHLVKQVFVAQHTIDFRRGVSGLLAEAYGMELDPYEGECLIFIHKSWRQIRFICGDEYGLYVGMRYFEGGALSRMFKFSPVNGFFEITQAEFGMLIEGANFVVNSRPKKFRQKLAS